MKGADVLQPHAKKAVSEFERLYRERDSRARLKARNHPGEYVEASRVQPVVEEWLARFERENDADGICLDHAGGSVGSIGAREALAFRAGYNVRTIWRLLDSRPKLEQKKGRPDYVTGGERFVSIDLVDRLFLAMGCENLFHVEPTNAEKTDGFADVYFHPSIMDDPEQSEEADDRFDRALALASTAPIREKVIA